MPKESGEYTAMGETMDVHITKAESISEGPVHRGRDGGKDRKDSIRSGVMGTTSRQSKGSRDERGTEQRSPVRLPNPELLGPLDTRKPQEYGDLGRGGKACYFTLA